MPIFRCCSLFLSAPDLENIVVEETSPGYVDAINARDAAERFMLARSVGPDASASPVRVYLTADDEQTYVDWYVTVEFLPHVSSEPYTAPQQTKK